MTPCHDEAMRALRIADRDIVAFRKMSGDPDFHFATTCYDDTDIPLISIAEVGAMVVAIRNWAGEQVK